MQFFLGALRVKSDNKVIYITFCAKAVGYLGCMYILCVWPDKQFLRKIVIIFLLISLNMFWVLKKIETVLLSTHNICFG